MKLLWYAKKLFSLIVSVDGFNCFPLKSAASKMVFGIVNSFIDIEPQQFGLKKLS